MLYFCKNSINVIFKDSESVSTGGGVKGRKPLVQGDTSSAAPTLAGEGDDKRTANATTSEGGTEDGSAAGNVSGSSSSSLKEDACRHPDNLSMFTTENLAAYDSTTTENKSVKFTASHHNKYSISSTTTSVDIVHDNGDNGGGTTGGNGVTGRTTSYIKAPFSTPVPAMVTPHATPPVTSDNTDKEAGSKYCNEKITLPQGIRRTLNNLNVFDFLAHGFNFCNLKDIFAKL